MTKTLLLHDQKTVKNQVILYVKRLKLILKHILSTAQCLKQKLNCWLGPIMDPCNSTNSKTLLPQTVFYTWKAYRLNSQ